MNATKVCKFNCTCIREECSFKHFIEDLSDREAFKDLYDVIFDKKIYNETDPDGIRKRDCTFGLLCTNENCGFKHYSNYEGRSYMRREWFKISRKTRSLNLLEDLKEKYKISDEDFENLKKIVDHR